MNRDWRDFKELYGNIAGAREAFENACEVLFKKQYPNRYVSQMEVSRGDGGIDVFIGEYSIEPIIVVQCKFFLEDFGNSQKQQIKDSFNKALNNSDYELSEWILGIPRVFTQKDNEWWFKWKQKQKINIRLMNGNELISAMQEHDVYNQIFQMEDSLRIKEIHDVLVPKKKEINILTHEKSFLDEVFSKIQANNPIMILSMTSSPFHYQVLKYYKAKIQKEMQSVFSEENIISFDLINTEIEEKFFQYITKGTRFKKNIGTGYEFVELIKDELNYKDVFLIINNFENGREEHLKKLADGVFKLWEDSHEYEFNIIIFGRKKLLSLRHIHGALSPLKMFKEVWIPIPTIEDYKQILGIDYDIKEIYDLVGGNPELLEFCIENYPQQNYREFLLSSEYTANFFNKYYSQGDKLLKLFEQDTFNRYHAFTHDELLRDLFWDNLIIKADNGQFKWIAPVVSEMGKRFFRC